MSDYKEVIKRVRQLESMLPGRMFGSTKTDWKAVWNQIKEIGGGFKGSRFPTKEERQAEWDKFQSLVARVKQMQEDERSKWDQKKRESEKLKDEIISKSYAAIPSSGSAEAILAVLTGGLSSVISAIMGPFDERKRELQYSSQALQEGWAMLHQYKDHITGQHKQEAFQALNNAKERLDMEWSRYKKERDQAYAEHRSQQAEKRAQWIHKVEDNISNLENKRERLNDALSKRESHLSDLYDKLSDARSDEYRSRVSDWISEEQENIQEIKRKLENVEDWLQEARDKLNR